MAAILTFSASLTAAAASPGPSERVQNLMSLDRPLVIAHRGYKMAAPENTIPAFEAAILAHADLVELDYYHSSDGVPFVIHDSNFSRTTNATKALGSEIVGSTRLSLAELKELDAGSWFSPLYAGTKLPTLAESLDVIQPGAVTLIERKQGDAQTVIDLLNEKEMLNDVIIQAFDWSYLADCRKIDSTVVLGALGPPGALNGRRLEAHEKFLNDEFLDMIEAAGANVVAWNRQVTPESVKKAHDRGLRVWVYTINDVDTAVNLLDMGVDGIISDNTPMVWKAIAIRK
jgi:glycerophosphoryl diester phosphodiesterase